MLEINLQSYKTARSKKLGNDVINTIDVQLMKMNYCYREQTSFVDVTDSSRKEDSFKVFAVTTLPHFDVFIELKLVSKGIYRCTRYQLC